MLTPHWRRLLAATPDIAGIDPDLLTVHWARRTCDTIVMGIEVRQGVLVGRRFWLKINRHDLSAARREFTFLQNANQRMLGEPSLAVVRPVAFWPEEGGLLTEHAEGEALSAVLMKSMDSSAVRAAQGSCLAGRWLARLQARPGGEILNEPYNFTALASAICGSFRRLRTDVVDCIHRLATKVRPGEEGLVLTHGDYGPHNMLRTATGLVVLDYANDPVLLRHHGLSAPAEDLARYASWILGVGLDTWQSPDRRRLVHSLFDAYRDAGGAPLTPSSPSYRLFLTYFLLCNLRDWSGRCVPWQIRPERSAVFRAWANELVADETG